jgi:hypothetical protein
VHNSIPVYYPAVSLGNLANGATSASFRSTMCSTIPRCSPSHSTTNWGCPSGI